MLTLPEFEGETCLLVLASWEVILVSSFDCATELIVIGTAGVTPEVMVEAVVGLELAFNGWVDEMEIVVDTVTFGFEIDDELTEVISCAGNTLTDVTGWHWNNDVLPLIAELDDGTGRVNKVPDLDVFVLRCWSLVGSFNAAIGTAIILPWGAGTNAIWNYQIVYRLVNINMKMFISQLFMWITWIGLVIALIVVEPEPVAVIAFRTLVVPSMIEIKHKITNHILYYIRTKNLNTK